MARFASIDIGSNAMRLRIVEADRASLAGAASSSWRDLAVQRAPVRLGREVFLTGALTNQAISSATEALRQFREAMDEAKVDQYRAVATSAVREAENAEVLVERAYREVGLHVEVIEGVEEARLVQLAVRRRLGSDQRSALLVDIGGGSTEVTLIEQGENRASQSLPLGTVRLLEAFMETDVPVDTHHAKLVDEYVERVLSELRPELSQARAELLVATGGNTETLLQLCPAAAGGNLVSLDAVRKLTLELSALPLGERMRRYNLRADRADTLVPAAQILLRVARRSGHTQLMVPGVGLKEGILEELIDKHFSRWNTRVEEDAITKACLRLGRRYQFDEAHGLLVAELSARIFDDLRSLHRLNERHRLLLKAAAILHDIGDFIRYEGHHKHSYYLIEHSDLMGVTPAERMVIANVARYHRKGSPDPNHPNFRDLSREDRSLVRALTSILRLADALDREHLGKVTDVTATVARGRLRLEVHGAPDHELEFWTVQRKSALFREVFALEVEVHDSPARRSAPPELRLPALAPVEPLDAPLGAGSDLFRAVGDELLDGGAGQVGVEQHAEADLVAGVEGELFEGREGGLRVLCGLAADVDRGVGGEAAEEVGGRAPGGGQGADEVAHRGEGGEGVGGGRGVQDGDADDVVLLAVEQAAQDGLGGRRVGGGLAADDVGVVGGEALEEGRGRDRVGGHGGGDGGPGVEAEGLEEVSGGLGVRGGQLGAPVTEGGDLAQGGGVDGRGLLDAVLQRGVAAGLDK